MSPEAITGTSTRSTSSAVSVWSAVPVYICSAERGCRVSDDAPASTSRGPTSRQCRRAVARARGASSPSRAGRPRCAIASTMRQARSGSSSSVAPAPVFVTFFTGQPKLTSTMSAPAASTIRAASPITLRVGAEELDRERMLVGRDAQVAERALVAVLDAGAADHLRADEAGAEAASLSPKRLHADAGHGREHEAGRDLDPGDRPGCSTSGHQTLHGLAAIG